MLIPFSLQSGWSCYTVRTSDQPELDLELFNNRSISAAQGGADRLEVCGNLGIGGGTTPSLGLVRAIQKALPYLPIMVGWPLSITDKSYLIRIPNPLRS